MDNLIVINNRMGGLIIVDDNDNDKIVVSNSKPFTKFNTLKQQPISEYNTIHKYDNISITKTITPKPTRKISRKPKQE